MVEHGFEFAWPQELALHDELLVAQRQDQRTSFRPGVNRLNQPVDVLLQERTAKKLSRAYQVLHQEYLCNDQIIEQALSYTNTLEDALRFLAFQLPSDHLPVKLRASGPSAGDTETSEHEQPTLQVVPSGPIRPRVVEEDVEQLDGEEEEEEHHYQVKGREIDDWEKEADAELAEKQAETAQENRTTTPDQADDAAVAKAWTQRFLKAESDEDEDERQEEANEQTRLETEYTELFEQMKQAKRDKQKRQVKALTLELDHRRLQLQQQFGWNEQEFLRSFYQRQAITKESSIAKQQKQQEVQGEEQVATIVQERANETTLVDEEQEQEDDGGFGSMFDDAETTVVSAEVIEKSAASHDEVKPSSMRSGLSPSLSSWTGKTPRVHLEEFCRKQKLPRPQFKKLHGGGGKRGSSYFEFSVVMTDTAKKNSKNEYELPKEIDRKQFTTMEEAKSAVATHVLYQLNPNLPLYRVLPPFYRELWCQWLSEVQERENSAANQQKQSFDNKIDAILQSIPEEICSKEVVAVTAGIRADLRATGGSSKMDQQNDSDDEVDDWEAGYGSSDDDVDQMLRTSGSRSQLPDQEEHQVPHLDSTSQQHNEAFEKRRRELRGLFQKHSKSKQYSDLLSQRQNLPIFGFRQQLVESLAAHDVILVSGETGCGKSTQVPQFVLTHLMEQNEPATRYPNIVCTQPRRLAAMSVAERVSRELGETRLGSKESLVGYQIRFESRTNVNTALTFCTTGVLLRKLQDPKAWDEISHVILDEVHERDVQIDLLLTILKERLEAQRKSRCSCLKVILMSATLNASSFQHYFGGKSECPLLLVPGRTFPVDEFFLEDILELTNHRIDRESRCYLSLDDDESTSEVQLKITTRGNKTLHQRVTYSASESTAEAARAMRKRALHLDESKYSAQTVDTLVHYDISVINYELIQDLVVFLIDSQQVKPSQAILIFLPGSQEIRTCLNLLAASPLPRGLQVELIPLHAGLSSHEQSKVFKSCASGIKVIASTNIAETSLTIEDVVVVIDSGKVKQLQQNPTKQINLLEETWCSKANAKQRAGRAGRVRKGVCYRLFTSHFSHSKLPPSSLAEIQRIGLTSICLLIKSLASSTSLSSKCEEFLAKCLEPPAPSRVQHAIEELLALGAMAIVDGEQKLTSLGKKLAQLPLDVKLGKMLLLGALFDCFDSISTVVALLESKSLFVAPMDQQRQLQDARKHFALGFSDMLTDVNAFEQWRRVRYQRDKATLHRFCERYYLNRRVLKEVQQMKSQFAQLVQQLGFCLELERGDQVQRDGAKSDTKRRLWLVASVIYASLAPNVAHVDPETLSKPRRKLRDVREELAFHPWSINSESALVFPSSPLFMTFPYKLHTSSVFLPVCGLVPLSGMGLFSASFKWVVEKQMVLLNDWIWLQTSPRSAVLMEHLRAKVQHQMQTLLDQPQEMSSSEWQHLRAFVEALCESEHQRLETVSTNRSHSNWTSSKR